MLTLIQGTDQIFPIRSAFLYNKLHGKCFRSAYHMFNEVFVDLFLLNWLLRLSLIKVINKEFIQNSLLYIV